MRYVRMLTNAAVGGLWLAAYLVVLVLQLNPHVPLASMVTVRWFGTMLAHYGPWFVAGVYVALLIREALAPRPLMPAWLSVRVLAWLGAAGAAAAAWATWANIRGFHAVLGDAATERMRDGATATTVAAVLLLAIALLRYSFGRRGSRIATPMLFVVLAGSIVVPMMLRGPGELPVPTVRRALATPPAGDVPRVRMILLDGASGDFVRRRVAAGQLPNLGRILDHGATLDLATTTPTQSVPVWAAAMTGKYAPQTGVRSAAAYRTIPDEDTPVTLLPDYCFAQSLVYQGWVIEDPYLTSASLHARTLWDILEDSQVASGIVNLPLTRPAHSDRGYIVSDYFDEASRDPLRLGDAASASPTTAAEEARVVFDDWQARPWSDAITKSGTDDGAPLGSQVAVWDHAYSETATRLEREFATRLTAVRYEGLNAFGKWYLQDAEPERFGVFGGSADRNRSVLDRYYAYIDAQIGKAMAELGPDDLLLVVSGFGMEGVTVSKRVLARVLGRPDPSGGHEHAPDGFLMAYGAHVARTRLPRGSIVDVTPTVLYYLGLPVGRDMDGFARTDLFFSSFTLTHPLKIIPTHEIVRVPER